MKIKVLVLVLLASASTVFSQTYQLQHTGAELDALLDEVEAIRLDSTTMGPYITYQKNDTVMASRSVYYNPSWTLDSTALATYGTNFDRTWFQTDADSLAVDSLVAVSFGRANGDTVSIRVIWGTDRTSGADSLSDLKCYHSAGGVAAASTKIIPPHRKVWVKITEEDGAAKEIQFAIKGRRKW